MINQKIQKRFLTINHYQSTITNFINKQINQVSGEVIISKIDHAILFTEHGKLTGSFKKPITVSNTWVWSFENNQTIQLAQARFGYDHQQALITLTTRDHSRWITQQPYSCGPDHYTAELNCDLNQLQLHWLIRGSKKHLQINTTYTNPPQS